MRSVSSIRGLAACVVAVAVLTLAAPHSASAAGPARLFTLAGLDSVVAAAPQFGECTTGACDVPVRWPQSWPAGERRLNAGCVLHLADGTIVLCHGNQLLALALDGRLRRWARIPVAAIGRVIDADIAPDGSVIALGEEGLARVRPDGSSEVVPVNGAAGEDWEPSAVAALPDGGALVTAQFESGRDVVRVAPDGRTTTLVASLPHDARHREFVATADDISRLADGSFALAQSGQSRVLRLTLDGEISVLAGGGRGFADGAVATAVDLGSVPAVASAPDGRVLIAAEHGVLSLSADGRLHVIAPSSCAGDFCLPGTPQSLSTDGELAARTRLDGAVDLDALPDGTVAVLASEPRSTGALASTRVVVVTPLAGAARFTVALAAKARATLRQGFADVIATRPASARLEIRRGRLILHTIRATLAVGQNRIRVPVAHGATGLTARVVATTATGQIAIHTLAFVPTAVLGRRELDRIAGTVQVWTTGPESSRTTFGCRRLNTRAFACLSSDSYPPVADGRARITLRPDGLAEYIARDRRGRQLSHWFLEPP